MIIFPDKAFFLHIAGRQSRNFLIGRIEKVKSAIDELKNGEFAKSAVLLLYRKNKFGIFIEWRKKAIDKPQFFV